MLLVGHEVPHPRARYTLLKCHALRVLAELEFEVIFVVHTTDLEVVPQALQ
jgi:hypothetical protein